MPVIDLVYSVVDTQLRILTIATHLSIFLWKQKEFPPDFSCLTKQKWTMILGLTGSFKAKSHETFIFQPFRIARIRDQRIVYSSVKIEWYMYFTKKRELHNMPLPSIDLGLSIWIFKEKLSPNYASDYSKVHCFYSRLLCTLQLHALKLPSGRI